MARYARLLSTLVLVILGFSSYGQSSNMQHPWRKRVSRYINMQDTARLNNAPGRSADSMLIAMILKEVMSGRATTYTTIYNSLQEEMTKGELNYFLLPRVDTMVIIDPISDKEVIKYLKKSLQLDSVYEYRLLEDWTYNPQDGKTTIQIAAIAPVMKRYGDDGTYRGKQAFFWMKLNDAIPIIQHYESYHPLNKLTDRIWQDYFIKESLLKPFAMRSMQVLFSRTLLCALLI